MRKGGCYLNRGKGILVLIFLLLGLWLAWAGSGQGGIRGYFLRQSAQSQAEGKTPDRGGEQNTDSAAESPASMPPFPSQVVIPSAPQASPAEEKVILPTTIEGGMVLSNDSGLQVDLEGLKAEGAGIRLSSKGANILIIHTHGSESYTSDGINSFTATDSFRTEDSRFNMIRVGDELAASLESYGLTVIHDREMYDYPSYTGSYGRSGAAVAKHLQEHPEISLVLDVHRDAIGSGDVIYKTLAEGGGKPCSQLMLLAGTGENGLPHPNWRENLKLALYLQAAVVEKYPTLPRPIALKKERYNQQLSTGSLILEVGSSGNTLEEALCAVRFFADAAAPALLKLRLPAD